MILRIKGMTNEENYVYTKIDDNAILYTWRSNTLSHFSKQLQITCTDN